MNDRTTPVCPSAFKTAATTTLGLALALGLVKVTSADLVELVSPNEKASGNFGISVSGIPDIDGDGLGDVIVGADAEDGGGVTDAGRAYVYSGGTGLLIRAHSSPNDELQGRYGKAVAGVPDINGDGRGDYVVGAWDENGAGISGSGRVYVYSGATGALIRTHNSPNAASNGSFGWSVAGVDDLNGDDRGDYVVGAVNEAAGGFNGAGRVYVYSGTNGALLDTIISPNPEFEGSFGWAVAGVPDVNPSGFPTFSSYGDFIVGAPDENPGGSPVGNGRTYLFSGLTGNLLDTFASPNPETSGLFGRAVGGLPDATGDGRGEVIVGAEGEDPGAAPAEAGRAYIFNGSTAALLYTLISPDQEAGGRFGTSVAGMPDHNGDGRGDVIVGAQYELDGQAHIFSGLGGSLITTLQPTGGTVAQFGISVAGVPDASADGRGDVIVGAHTDEGAGEPFNSGRAYLYRFIANDTCNIFFSDVINLSVGETPFTTIGATEGAAENDCIAFGDAGPDVWFSHTSSCTGTMTVSTCLNANFNTQIAVYQGCGLVGLGSCNLDVLLGCDAGPISCLGGTDSVSVPVVADGCYYIRIGGDQNESGSGNVTISYSNCTDCPADLNNDGTVGGADIALVLGQWGGAGSADLSGDGVVGGADIAIVLGAWGPCPG